MLTSLEEYNNNHICRYVNSVLQDVGIKEFEVIFGEDASEGEDIYKKWEEFVHINNIKTLAYLALDRVLRVSNGVVILKKGKKGFNFIDGDALTIEKASKDYIVYENKDLVIKNNNKEVDTISNLWIYYSSQSPNHDPIGKGETYSYVDIWRPVAHALEEMIRRMPVEIRKSNAMFLSHPELGNKTPSRGYPESTDEIDQKMTEIVTSMYEGGIAGIAPETKVLQLPYTGTLLFTGIEKLWEQLSMLTAIPLSQLIGLTVGGLNTSGISMNDTGNYIKLINKIQNISKQIWFFFAKSFAQEQGNYYAENSREIKIRPPEVHQPSFEALVTVMERLVALKDSNIPNTDVIDGVLEKMGKRLAERS